MRCWRITGFVVLSTMACAHAAPRGSPAAASLDGAWIVTTTEASGTELQFRMTFEVSDGRLDAYSRAGAVDQVIPWYQSVAGRLLRKLPRHGALVLIDGEVTGNEIKGQLVSPLMRRYDVRAVFTGDRIDGKLLYPNFPDFKPGRISAVRSTSTKPLRDYIAIGERARDSAAVTIYDPGLIHTKVYRQFFDGFLADMRRAQDDLDAAVAFNSRSQKLPFTHTGFIRNPRIAAMSYDELVFGDTTMFPDTLVTLSFPGPGVAMLRISRWERVLDAVDRAFQRIDSARADILILDFRSNPGGDWTAMAPLSHLFADSVPLGFGMSSIWHSRHPKPPTALAPGIPLLTNDSTGLSLITSLHSVGVVAVTATPRAPLFKGKVFLLIDSRAGSASELPAEALRSSGRATLIGTRTAGAMLLALPHRAGDGWIMLFPEADFVMTSGKIIEGHGVAPHVEAARGTELHVVADSVAARSPIAAAMLRALGSYRLGQLDDAERHYREAERLSPTGTAWTGVVFVAMARKQWDTAFALVDRRARTDTSPNVAITRARVAVAAGRELERSVDEMRAILQRRPAYGTSTRANAHKRLGQLLLAAGDTASARAELAESVALEPRDAEALSTLARLKR